MNFNPKKFFSIAGKVLMNSQVLMLLAMLGVIIYLGGFETAYKGNVDKLAKFDRQIEEKKKELAKKQEEVDKLKKFENELKGIVTEIPELKKGDALKIVALTESTRITDLAKGIGRDAEKNPILPPPNDKLELLSFAQVAESTVDVAEELAGPSAKKKKKKKKPDEAADAPQDKDTVSLTRFDYEMKVRGTYPAVADLVNQLVQFNNLIVLNKVLVSKAGQLKEAPNSVPTPLTPQSGDESPGADGGGSVAKVDMLINLSLFFYASTK